MSEHDALKILLARLPAVFDAYQRGFLLGMQLPMGALYGAYLTVCEQLEASPSADEILKTPFHQER